MLFTSYTYLVFLVLAVLVIRLTRGIAREYVLLAASLVFYAWWDVRFLVVLLGLGAFTYMAGRGIARHRGRPRALILPIAAILLVLGVFKYTGLLVDLINLMRPADSLWSLPGIILPLGISFYTFECVSYLIDVYKGGEELQPLRRFLLFPAFWPHMVAGPILRLKEFAPQLSALGPVTAASTLYGVDRVLAGLVKKLVIANALAEFVDRGFAGDVSQVSGLDSWVLALAFGLQIYFDFSAYTDIAIGSARLVGFVFPENFNLPYHATSPSEFWNRWHMTLSRWIRDYVFFPLNLKAGRRIWLRHAYLVFTMALVGLWHGAGLTFVLWGVWHGVLMVTHRLCQPVGRRLPAFVGSVWGGIGFVATVALVNAGWVLFRATSVSQAFELFGEMFTLQNLTPAYGVNDYLTCLGAIAAYLVAEPLLKKLWDRNPDVTGISELSYWLRPAFYVVALTLTMMFDTTSTAFIYFQF